MTVTRRAAALLGLALAGAALAGCGSNNVAIKTAGTNAPVLSPPPAVRPPASQDYTTLTAILAPLKGVATCNNSGPGAAVCSLLTTTTNFSQIADIRPFQVKVFTTTAATQAYVTLVEETNETRASTGTAIRNTLTGPHWVVTPQTTTAGLLTEVQAYLGGTLVP
jgi:hypothetical protein